MRAHWRPRGIANLICNVAVVPLVAAAVFIPARAARADLSFQSAPAVLPLGAATVVQLAPGGKLGYLGIAIDPSGSSSNAVLAPIDPARRTIVDPNSDLSAGLYPNAIRSADLTGNGLADAVTLNSRLGYTVIHNRGDGFFDAAGVGSTSVAGAPADLELADITGDGRPDLVLACRDHLAVLPGRGDRTFGPERDYALPGLAPASLGLSDVDHSGHAAVLVFDSTHHRLVTLKSTPAGLVEVNADPVDPRAGPNWTVGDVTGDGIPDAIFTVGTRLAIVAGRFGGGFGRTRFVKVGFSLDNPITAALTGTRRASIAVSEPLQSRVAIISPSGRGFEVQQLPRDFGRFPVVSVAQDLNGDGRPDLAVVGYRRQALLLKEFVDALALRRRGRGLELTLRCDGPGRCAGRVAVGGGSRAFSLARGEVRAVRVPRARALSGSTQPVRIVGQAGIGLSRVMTLRLRVGS